MQLFNLQSHLSNKRVQHVKHPRHLFFIFSIAWSAVNVLGFWIFDR